MRDYFGALAFWLIMLAQFGAVIFAARRCQRGRTGISARHEPDITKGSCQADRGARGPTPRCTSDLSQALDRVAVRRKGKALPLMHPRVLSRIVQESGRGYCLIADINRTPFRAG